MTSASLYIYDYKDPDAASPLRQVEIIDFLGSADFHTLGMAYDEATSTLFASNHAQAGPRIETFRLDLDKLTATHIGTLEHPLIHGPNSIAIINSQEIYVTNDKFFLARYTKVLSKLETVLAFPLGSVVHVKLSDRDGGAFRVEKAHRVARAAFANGIELLNSTTVALASTTKSSIYLYDMNADRTLTFKSSFRLPFMPDNLSVHGNRLLIAGHPHFPSLAKYTVTRHVCNDPAELVKASAELKEYCQNGKATSWVAEWTEQGGLKNIYIGTEYPTSATAAWDSTRGVGIISGLYAKGLLVWRDSPEH